MSLHQLIYMSELTTDESVLASIHSHAVRNNTARTVTGMLLFARGKFLQVLEGERKDVHLTFERIKEDPRHDHVIILADRPILERNFSHWNMGFRHLKEDELVEDHSANEFFSQNAEEARKNPQPALPILQKYAK